MKNNRFISRILFFFLLAGGGLVSCGPGGNPNGSASPPRDSCHTIGLTYKDTCMEGFWVFLFRPTATSASCGTYLSYMLNFGDGTSSSGSVIPLGTINHVYPGPGPYTVQLIVTWPPCAIGPRKCDTISVMSVMTHTVNPCGSPTDSCPNCSVRVHEDSCVPGNGIMRRKVTFTPVCSGPTPMFFSYDLKGGTLSSGTLSGMGGPGTITALYQSNPFLPPPTLTVWGPGSCPPKTINIPYTAITPCDPPCPDITNIAVNVVDSCATVNGARGHWVSFTPSIVNGPANAFMWVFNAGSPVSYWAAGTPVPITHFYPTASGGPYSALLYIFGPTGKICDSLTVTFNMKRCTCDPCDTIVNIQVQAPTDCSQVIDGAYPVTFTATISGQCPPTAYLWNFGDGTPTVTTSGPTVQHTYQCPHMTPPYFVTLNLIGCEGNPGYVSPSKSVPISFIPCACPTIDNINVDQTACILNVSASISGSCPDAVTQYIWDFGDGTSVAVTPPGTNATHTYTSSGDYWVTLTLAGVGPDCFSAKLIHVDCGGGSDGNSECFHWPLKKWYCWLFTILFAIAFIALAITLFTSIITNAGASWVTCLALFIVALALAILLAILCHCCFALWALYYLLLLVTIILLILALATNTFWTSFFIALVLTITVAILIYVLCGSCLALWILFFLFLVLSLIFLGYALCILSGGSAAPPGFWLKFLLMIILAIVLAVIIHKLCGGSICAYLLSLTSATMAYALILSIIDARFRPCSSWLTGTTSFPSPPATPIFHIPNMWFYTTFFWLIWYIVCHLFG